MLFPLTDSPQKLKSENIHDTLIIPFYVSPNSSATNTFLFLLKHKKNKCRYSGPRHLKLEVAN